MNISKWPYYSKDEIDAVKDILDSGNVNVTRELLNYCLGSADENVIHRVHDMINDASGGAYSGEVGAAYDVNNIWVPFTFKDGDVIKFQLKYKVDQITTGYVTGNGVDAGVIDPINLVNYQSGGIAKDAANHQLGTNIVTDQIYLVEMRIVGDEAGRS